MADGLRSGQVAAAAGVNLQTLRYYERRGLIEDPQRTLGGHRLYPEEAVTTLRVIKAAQLRCRNCWMPQGTVTASARELGCKRAPARSWPMWKQRSRT